MKVIYRYTMVSRHCEFEVPKGGKVLDVQIKSGEDLPSIWILIETDNMDKKETRKFHSYGTGVGIPGDPGKYIGTFQDGSLMHHVFEEKSEKLD